MVTFLDILFFTHVRASARDTNFGFFFIESVVLKIGDAKMLYPSVKQPEATKSDVRGSNRKPVSLYERLARLENQGMKRLHLSLEEFGFDQELCVEKVRRHVIRSFIHAFTRLFMYSVSIRAFAWKRCVVMSFFHSFTCLFVHLFSFDQGLRVA